jgi:hypothetical protein
MQSLKKVSVSLIFLMGCFTQGCGWQKTMTFRSPSRKAVVEVWQTRFANEWGTKVEFVTSDRKSVLLENRKEAIVYFVHVYWSRDENTVGVIVTGGNNWSIAYDVKLNRTIPFESIREEVGESIRNLYQVPIGEDPVRWAATSDAQSAFFALHPGVRLSYH